MRETTRAHQRLLDGDDEGTRLHIRGLLPVSVDLFIPRRSQGLAQVPLVLHFMGATWVPRRAAASTEQPLVVAAVSLGSGSSANAHPFVGDTTRFVQLLEGIRRHLSETAGAPGIGKVYLSGWSAGYGAIREILRHPGNGSQVHGILLLDGLHASYRPDRRLLADGGVIDSLDLAPFLPFAREAMEGSKRMLITHSEIFPGTYASTTETTDWLLARLGVARTPVLEWGPVGSQIISRAVRGGFEVVGMAGNSAPDHVDHLHGMAGFLTRLLAP